MRYKFDWNVLFCLTNYFVSRQNQKTSFHIESPGIATVGHTGTIIDNPNHHLEGTGYASKDLSRGFGLKPDAYGGRADYSHKPSGAGFGLGADHFRGAGKARVFYLFIS